MKQLFFVILILSTSTMLADWPVTEDAGPYEYRDVLGYENRDPMDIGFCDCPCDSVIKSVKVYQNQEDDEVFLSAGYNIQGKHCQRIEIVVNACYQQTLSSIDFKFDLGDSTDYCFDAHFFVYRSVGGNPENAVLCNEFDPKDAQDNEGIFCLQPPVDACSSATFTFYICSNNIDFCEHDDIPVTLSVGNCNIDMMFHFDFYTGVLQLVRIGNRSIVDNYKPDTIGNTWTYKLINIFDSTVIEGEYSTLTEIKEQIGSIHNLSGLYIVQIFNGRQLISQDKIYLTNGNQNK